MYSIASHPNSPRWVSGWCTALMPTFTERRPTQTDTCTTTQTTIPVSSQASSRAFDREHTIFATKKTSNQSYDT